MPSAPIVAPVHARDTLPMTVADMTFLVGKLGSECDSLQFVRELTQNAIEGIQQLPDRQGDVIWDVAWNHHDLLGVYKLACVDTGSGMTGQEMEEYINKLSSSRHQQSATGNFGVGAKIAAAPRNPHGLLYLSWKDGVGYMVHLWFDPEKKAYGLKRWPKTNEFWTRVSNDLKPPQIGDHGTMVILLGKSDDDVTADPPHGARMPSRWVLRYLNTRYFKFPEGTKVWAREGWTNPRTDTKHNFLREVKGQGPWLNDNAESRGVVSLANAHAHWWILRDGIDTDSGHNAGGNHMAALYQDELYELASGRSGIARLQSFGVIFGTRRVVIYVEPVADNDNVVSANTARTQLLIGESPLPWVEWAAEFRDRMPDELVSLQDELGAEAGATDHKKAIRERLKQIRDLLRFSRIRPSASGSASGESESSNFGGQSSAESAESRTRNRPSGGKGGRSGDLYALFAETGDTPGDPVDGLSEPEVIWQDSEEGLEDRAARFLMSSNTLLINGSFRVFTDMIDRWVKVYSQVAGAEGVIRDVVREWFEQQLIETVMSAMALRKAGRWSGQELEALWSEEALTAAVLPRWHIDQSVKRMLGHRLGRSEAQP